MADVPLLVHIDPATGLPITDGAYPSPHVNDNQGSQTLTDGATLTWDLNSGLVARVTLAGNRTMAAPLNLRVGTFLLTVIQDGTGSRTITWNAAFKWAGGTAPTLTTTAAAKDVLSFFYDGTNIISSLSVPDAR